ncbi:MAG: hypothetical protein ACHQ7M_10870, partial [Chloroflexota bacterium]
ASVAATVVIADTTLPAERGRCMRLNDSMTADANMLMLALLRQALSDSVVAGAGAAPRQALSPS